MNLLQKNGDGQQKRTLLTIAGVTVFALLLAIAGWARAARPNAYELLVDGSRAGIIASPQEAEKVLQSLLAEKGGFVPRAVKYREKIEIRPLKAKRKEIISGEELRQILNDKLTFTTAAIGIAINGEVRLAVADEQAAQTVIERIKDTYRPKIPGISLKGLELKEQITFVLQEVNADEIKGVDEAVTILKDGLTKVQKYTVQAGDSLWTIAKNNNITVEALQAANPQLSSDHLDIGQELNLTKAVPLVQVVATYVQTAKQSVPYSTKVVADSKLPKGQERVQQPGKAGEKEIKYRIVEKNGIQVAKEVVEEKIVVQPIPKVIAKGTRILQPVAGRGRTTPMVSRDGGSVGVLSWPLRGPITSPFGFRQSPFGSHREFHSGLDIDGSTGDPVRAAEAGTVVFVGWLGAYGNRVVIDHGGGLQTGYNHLSGFKTKIGDKVTRGQIIGLVGSTGRSTGSHLDFQVMVNGVYKDPLNYLRR